MLTGYLIPGHALGMAPRSRSVAAVAEEEWAKQRLKIDGLICTPIWKQEKKERLERIPVDLDNGTSAIPF